MHAFKAAKRNANRIAKQNETKTLIVFIAPVAINTPVMHYVVSTRGAYAMQTGNTVNAKNIKVYAVFANAEKAIAYIGENKMHLFAAHVAQ